MISPGVVGLGVVIRDSYGFIIAAAVRRVHAFWAVNLAEAMAIFFGLSMAISMGLNAIWAESDALNVVLGVTNPQQNNTYLGSIMEDIRKSLAKFSKSHLSFVKKSGNCVAHFLARLIPNGEGDSLYSDNFPPGLIDLAEIDIT